MRQKPVGTVMTATEISSVSGRINQLLHPEDSVQISPFEQLAVSTPNDSFDHVVGNVPFGGRDNTRNIDKPYAEETDMGSYFMLRMLDKIKPWRIHVRDCAAVHCFRFKHEAVTPAPITES